jgi:hypothetical protein
MMDATANDPISIALREDLGAGDVTTQFFVPENLHALGKIIARERCVVAGTEVAAEVSRAPAELMPIVMSPSEENKNSHAKLPRNIVVAYGHSRSSVRTDCAESDVIFKLPQLRFAQLLLKAPILKQIDHFDGPTFGAKGKISRFFHSMISYPALTVSIPFPRE